MNHVIQHFKKVDPVLHAAINGEDWKTLTRIHDHFMGLCRIIVGQQVSTKAAQSIFNKFCTLFSRKKPTAKRALQLTVVKLQSAGLSRSKAAAIHDLAQHIVDKKLHLKKFAQMGNDEIVTELVKVRGIGPWSAEMFLIFYLGREDVFSPGDLGLRTAIMKLYKKRALPSPEAATKLAECWSPYRSYACKILWDTLNNAPAQTKTTAGK